MYMTRHEKDLRNLSAAFEDGGETIRKKAIISRLKENTVIEVLDGNQQVRRCTLKAFERGEKGNESPVVQVIWHQPSTIPSPPSGEVVDESFRLSADNFIRVMPRVVEPKY